MSEQETVNANFSVSIDTDEIINHEGYGSPIAFVAGEVWEAGVFRDHLGQPEEMHTVVVAVLVDDEPYEVHLQEFKDMDDALRDFAKRIAVRTAIV